MKLKNILSLLLLIGSSAMAQSLHTNTIDKQTGIRTITTNNHKGKEIELDDAISRSGALFFSAGYQQITKKEKTSETYFIELNIVHNDARLGCLENGKGRVLITLADETQIDCIQISDNDCDPIGFVAAFALMPKDGNQEVMKQNFEKLKTTDILKMEVFTTEKSVLYTIKSKSRPYIKNHFTLIDKTIKQ